VKEKEELPEKFSEDSPFRYGGEVYETLLPNDLPAKRIVKKFELPNPDPTGLKATAEEKRWIELFMQSGNAYWAVLQAWPRLTTKSQSYARTKGSNLMKKFGLRGQSKRIRQELAAQNRLSKTADVEKSAAIVNHTKQLYMSGAINEEELFSRMDKLSRNSISDQARIVATREIREWLKEAQSEVEANNLAMMEIIPLMVNALADLPKEKYAAVLKGCRAKRQKLIQERTAKYNAEEIRQKERERLSGAGGVILQGGMA